MAKPKFQLKTAPDPNADRFAKVKKVRQALEDDKPAKSPKTAKVERVSISLPADEKAALETKTLELAVPVGERLTTSRVIRAALAALNELSKNDQVAIIKRTLEPTKR